MVQNKNRGFGHSFYSIIMYDDMYAFLASTAPFPHDAEKENATQQE